MQPKDSPYPVSIVTEDRTGGTLIIAAVNERNTEYLLLVEGYDHQNLKIDFDVVTGDCCTSVTIKKVYQNGNPASDTGNGSVTIKL
ncbi:hypothetical protein ABID22_003002 [Pontibacter aydingkolensis]|uniref:Uncharacterized protein n=1 Tax=Pontibacter aydingkolensis TaxID=1911536 RepID=A0ABS7CVH0_9BACT|nr:hypothetical protein [Pontibacter aydingkolensis]MBW7467487.1 hypothetical protein [Pontibacter aydingkolensis]